MESEGDLTDQQHLDRANERFRAVGLRLLADGQGSGLDMSKINREHEERTYSARIRDRNIIPE